ncbi:MAG: ribose-5-phosphate isomerase [Candidatus Magasanikbacteria bacterium]|nr:ribose-5-phosphate isomerase [Candidatus Magasanikbacteria bacterium]
MFRMEDFYTGPLFIASDHAGFRLKNRTVRYIQNELHLEVQDLGPTEYDPQDDYPDYIIPLTQKVRETQGRGIVVCGSGIGVCIAANKVAGIRCGIGYNSEVAESMMQHNNTNVLALAGGALSEDHAKLIVKTWLMNNFTEEERHVRRLGKIAKLEK